VNAEGKKTLLLLLLHCGVCVLRTHIGFLVLHIGGLVGLLAIAYIGRKQAETGIFPLTISFK
jgi:hypothetical protein